MFTARKIAFPVFLGAAFAAIICGMYRFNFTDHFSSSDVELSFDELSSRQSSQTAELVTVRIHNHSADKAVHRLWFRFDLFDCPVGASAASDECSLIRSEDGDAFVTILPGKSEALIKEIDHRDYQPRGTVKYDFKASEYDTSRFVDLFSPH